MACVSARHQRVPVVDADHVLPRRHPQHARPEQCKRSADEKAKNLQKVMAASRIWEERDKVGSMKGPMRKRKENAGGRVGKLSGWDRVTTQLPSPSPS